MRQLASIQQGEIQSGSKETLNILFSVLKAGWVQILTDEHSHPDVACLSTDCRLLWQKSRRHRRALTARPWLYGHTLYNCIINELPCVLYSVVHDPDKRYRIDVTCSRSRYKEPLFGSRTLILPSSLDLLLSHAFDQTHYLYKCISNWGQGWNKSHQLIARLQ